MASSLCCRRRNGSTSPSIIGGNKGIGFWSGCQLLSIHVHTLSHSISQFTSHQKQNNSLINNMVGPALVLIPALFQKYGYLPILSMLCVACLLSFFCGLMLTHVIANIRSSPNRNIANKRPEMNHIIDFYFTTHIHLKRFILCVYISSLILTLVSNIIQSAQIIDLAIRDIFGCSYALELYPSVGSIICGNAHSDVTPFGSGIYVISMGFLMLAWICLILYSVNYNLDDNIYLQWVANIGLLLLSVIWLSIFFDQDTFDISRIGMLHENASLNVDCVGIILFNFAFIVTIPSWYNEKSQNAPVIKSLLYSIVFVAFLFLVIGILGAMSFEYADLSNDNQSLFTVIDDFGGSIGKISVYLYPIIQNITSIPVFCIIIRYNLQNSGLSKYFSNFISIIVPWLLAIPLFTGSGFTNLCDFTGIILGSVVNFILPPFLYLLSIQMIVRPFKYADSVMIPLSASDTNDDEEDEEEEESDSQSKEKTKNMDNDSDATEEEQLIEVMMSKDVDIAKKNEIKWSQWDVIVAVICIAVSVVLSLVVVIEKCVIMMTKTS